MLTAGRASGRPLVGRIFSSSAATSNSANQRAAIFLAANQRASSSSADAEKGKGVGDVALPMPRRSGQDSSFRKGSGGRMSFSGNVATVFGATGFSGRYLINRLARDGTQMIIPYRCDPYNIRELRVMCDLGQILFFPFELRDEDSIRKVMKYSNVVINNIGRDYETVNYSFEQVHIEGARRLARLAREMGVQRFIHVSAMNASPNPKEYFIPGGSQYLKTKGLAEQAVKEEFPDAVIVRPADMYGLGDKLLNYWSYWYRRYLFSRVDVYKRGLFTYKMPLFVSDFAAGIQRIVQDPTIVGQTVEFVGPECYQLADAVDYFFRRIGKGEYDGYRRRDISPYFRLKCNLMEWKTWIMKSQPKFNWEMLERIECNSDILTGVPTLHDIGVRNLGVFPLASRMAIDMHSRVGWMEASYGEFPEPPEPTALPPLTYKSPERGDVGVTETKTWRSADPEYYKKTPRKQARIILPGVPETPQFN